MAETARAHVVLPRKLLDEIDALVGKRKRSEFIVEVLERRIVNARQIRALAQVRAFADANPDAGPPEWATAESTAEWVRQQRRMQSGRERWLEENWYPSTTAEPSR